MFLERKLKDQSVWINIDSDDVKKNGQIYQDYNIDLETIGMRWIKTSELTWTIIARMGRFFLSIMC